MKSFSKPKPRDRSESNSRSAWDRDAKEKAEEEEQQELFRLREQEIAELESRPYLNPQVCDGVTLLSLYAMICLLLLDTASALLRCFSPFLCFG